MPDYTMPRVAIIGRPNVGKSTLFNRLIKRRKAIVQHQSGTTRDRLYETVDWSGRQFTIIDTGGHKLAPDEEIHSLVNQEVIRAVSEASLIVFLVENGHLTAEDFHLAQIVKRSEKQVLYVVNKVDHEGACDVNDAYRVGFPDPIFISAEHGLNIDTLLDAMVRHLPVTAGTTDEKVDFRLAIIGEPNAGKSTLLNVLLNKERAIVSETAGTTRDAVEDILAYDQHSIMLVDTAGMKKKQRYQDASSFFGLTRARAAIRAADIVLILFDAAKGPQRDTRALFEFIEKGKKASLIVVNKWDLMQATEMRQYEMHIKELNAFMREVPMFFISALTGRNVALIMPAVIGLWHKYSCQLGTPVLNAFLERIDNSGKLPSHCSLKYITQTGTRPPSFVIFVNNKKHLKENHMNFIRNQLIEQYSLHGVQVDLTFRTRMRK